MRGWEIYRIWSLDWYRNRTTEVERLRKYLESKRHSKESEYEPSSDLLEAIEPRPEADARDAKGYGGGTYLYCTCDI